MFLCRLSVREQTSQVDGKNEKGHNQGVKYAIEDMEKWLELFQDIEPSQRKSSVLEVAASITRIAELLGEKSLVEVASTMKIIDDLHRKMTDMATDHGNYETLTGNGGLKWH